MLSIMSGKVRRQRFWTFSEWVFIHNMLASTHTCYYHHQSPPPTPVPPWQREPHFLCPTTPPERDPPPAAQPKPAPTAANMFIIFLLLAASVARAFFSFPSVFLQSGLVSDYNTRHYYHYHWRASCPPLKRFGYDQISTTAHLCRTSRCCK